ncbi:MAG: hypothetical protein ACREBW_10040, partial [Candidatus Micrarchaeaceae archaeon]
NAATQYKLWQQFEDFCANFVPSGIPWLPNLYYKELWPSASVSGPTGRGPFLPEMREDFWQAIASGVKGFFFNTFGMGDGGGLADGNGDHSYNGPNDNPESYGSTAGVTQIGSCSNPFFTAIPDPTQPHSSTNFGFDQVEIGHADNLWPILPNQYVPLLSLWSYLRSESKTPTTPPTAAQVQDFLAHNKIDIWNWTSPKITNDYLPDPANWTIDNACAGVPRYGLSTYMPGQSGWQPIEGFGPAGDDDLATINVQARDNTYYGFSDRWQGALQDALDANSISKPYGKLQWLLSLDLKDINFLDIDQQTGVNSNPTWIQFPIEENVVSGVDETSQKFERYALSTVRSDGTDASDPSYADGAPFDQFVGSRKLDGVKDTDITGDHLFRLGLFQSPDEPDNSTTGGRTRYVVITNSRTWPVIRDTNKNTGVITIRSTEQYTDIEGHSHTEKLLGGIDRRRFNFLARRSIVDPKNQYDYYSFKNLRTGEEYTHPWGTIEHIDLDPGEGTLIRIAPATTLEVGRASYAGASYNNGNHVCEVQTAWHPSGNPPSSSDYCNLSSRGVTWESNGSIMFRLVQPAGSGGAVFADATTSKVIYTAPSGHTQDGHNPSIAAKGDTIAIVYSIDNFVGYSGSRSVWCAISTDAGATWPTASNVQLATGVLYTSPAPFSVVDYLPEPGGDPTGVKCDLLVPVVTPAIDGFMTAYTTPAVIVPAFVHYAGGNWSAYATPTLAPPPSTTPLQLRFGSISSRFDYVYAKETEGTERFHFAYEADALTDPGLTPPSSAIFYTYVDHTFNSPIPCSQCFTHVMTTSVSGKYPYCIHRHPHIA